MLGPYLLFRIRQTGRFLNSIGIGYLIVVLLLLSGSFFQGLSNLMMVNTIYIIGGFAILLLGIFFHRKDVDFLKSTNLNLYVPFIVDAFLIGLPFSIILFVLNKWQAGIGVWIVCLMVAIIRAAFGDIFDSGSKSHKIGAHFSLFPFKDFELNFLTRQYFWMLIPIYIITLIFSWHVASIFVISFVILLSLQGTLEYYEPAELIFNDDAPAKFLFKKTFRVFLWLCLILIPFYLIGLYYNSSQWYLYILVIVSIFLLTAFSVFNKYVFYRPNTYRIKGNVLAAIMLIFMFIPGFQLVVLFMAILQFFKAKRNLNFYQ